MVLNHFPGTKKRSYNKAHFGAWLELNDTVGWLCILLKAYSRLWWVVIVTWLHSEVTGFFACAWGNSKSCASADVCLRDGPIFIKQCYYQSSSSGLPIQSCFSLFYCDVSLPLSLSLSHLVATYTSKLYLPRAQCQVSHQGLCCDAESAGVWVY